MTRQYEEKEEEEEERRDGSSDDVGDVFCMREGNWPTSPENKTH